MAKKKPKPVSPFHGRWHIVSMTEWDEDYLNEEVQAFIEFDDKGDGSFQFGYVQGTMDCRETTRDGKPCIEAKVPQDVEDDLAMPGGHIFHGDLEWPWAGSRQTLDTPAQQWGVATDSDAVLLCGSGARRGGAVSGLGGHNAAQAVLASR